MATQRPDRSRPRAAVYQGRIDIYGDRQRQSVPTVLDLETLLNAALERAGYPAKVSMIRVDI